MTEQARRPVVNFDHHSQEHAADPVGSYRALRQSAPVAWSEAHGGFWVICGYDSLFDAARDDATFSSARNSHGGEGLSVVIPKTPMHHHIPIEIDPPDFRKYRKIINLITSPAAAERMSDLILDYTTWFIDDVIEAGECDFASVIGVPAAVTIAWLGLPVQDWRRYAAAHHAVLASEPGSAEYMHAATVELPSLSRQMAEVIAARHKEPRDDVISFLVNQEIDGAPISEDDVFSMIELLIAGGTGTTASLVGQTLVWLYEHRDVRRQLTDHSELLPRAVEEFLRCFSPTQALARTVTADVEFHSCPMREGDRVLLSWASANRDAALFEDPDTIDIERWPNRHAAFGLGIHRCAGAHIARILARTLLGQILERMPDYVIDTERLEPYLRQGVNAGWRKIPARFTPGPRRGTGTSTSL
jgi:cytochrome P450